MLPAIVGRLRQIELPRLRRREQTLDPLSRYVALLRDAGEQIGFTHIHRSVRHRSDYDHIRVPSARDLLRLENQIGSASANR